jgi:hypothetical protein
MRTSSTLVATNAVPENDDAGGTLRRRRHL